MTTLEQSASVFDQARGVLGVQPGVDLEELESAYRRAAKTAHPDRGGSEEAFQQVRIAFEVLKAEPVDGEEDEGRARFPLVGWWLRWPALFGGMAPSVVLVVAVAAGTGPALVLVGLMVGAGVVVVIWCAAGGVDPWRAWRVVEHLAGRLRR